MRMAYHLVEHARPAQTPLMPAQNLVADEVPEAQVRVEVVRIQRRVHE